MAKNRSFDIREYTTATILQTAIAALVGGCSASAPNESAKGLDVPCAGSCGGTDSSTEARPDAASEDARDANDASSSDPATPLDPADSSSPSSPPANAHWVASWGAAAVPMEPQPYDAMPAAGLTYRNIVRMSLGGSQARITLSNLKGTEPLHIDDVTIALSKSGDSVDANSLKPVTFTVAGKSATAITIAPGQTVSSDPVALPMARQADVAVSMHVPKQTISIYTDHPLGHGTNYYASGDQAGATSLSGATPFEPWHFLSAVDVMAPATSAAIVAFGDSITDGAGDDPRGSNERWPNYFADRLYQANHTSFSIVNEGIGSDRVLTDAVQNDRSGATPSALHRWNYDALQRAGVKYVVMIEGVNDIDAATNPPANPRGPVIGAADLIDAYKTLTAQAHASGVKVIFGTLTPFGDAAGWTAKGQQIHDDVNAWIRAGNGFDGFVDFEKATQDPAQPTKYRAGFDSGDGLHPSHLGKQAMAEAIAVTLFAAP